jgi:hypothetical protein
VLPLQDIVGLEIGFFAWDNSVLLFIKPIYHCKAPVTENLNTANERGLTMCISWSGASDRAAIRDLYAVSASRQLIHDVTARHRLDVVFSQYHAFLYTCPALLNLQIAVQILQRITV